MSKRTFELINRWTAGTLQSRKHEGNIYFDSLAIYSYGTHFPIVVKNPSGLLIGNGDRYSSSTSQHQSIVRSAVNFDVLVPFSGLSTLGVDAFRDRIEVIHHEQDKQIPTKGRRKNRQTGQMEEYTYDRHVLGGSLIHVYARDKDKRVEDKDSSDGKWVSGKESKTPRVFVQAWDETGTARRGEGGMFFMSELPKEGRGCKTVEEALAMLKPGWVHEFEAITEVEVQRQGEWFFVPATPKPKRGVPFGEGVLKGRVGGTGHHWVERMMVIGKKQYCSGAVRHNPREHKTLFLGESWYQAVENTAVVSVSLGGNVD